MATVPRLHKETSLFDKSIAHDLGEVSDVANAASPKADAIKRTQRIWYRKNSSGAPSTPGTQSSNWVTKADDGSNAWTKMHIAITSTDKYIYTCEQYEMANGTVGYTSVLLDNTITVIDGGNIITGTVSANAVNAASGTFDSANIPNLDASKITTGQLSAQRIDTASLTCIGPEDGRHVLITSEEFEFKDGDNIRAMLAAPTSGVENVMLLLNVGPKDADGYATDYIIRHGGRYSGSDEVGSSYIESSYASGGIVNIAGVFASASPYISQVQFIGDEISIASSGASIYNASSDNLGFLLSARILLAEGDITVPANGGAQAILSWEGPHIATTAGTTAQTAASFPDTNYVVSIGKSGNGVVNGFNNVDFMVIGKATDSVTVYGWNNNAYSVTLHVTCIGFNSRYGTRSS